MLNFRNVPEAARTYLQSGLSVFPVQRDTLRPADTVPWNEDTRTRDWRRYQRTRATIAEARDLFSKHTDIAVICGRVSSGLVVLDFADSASYHAWFQAVGTAVNDLTTQVAGKRERYQVFFRCVTSFESADLAFTRAGRVVVRLIGEGDCVVIAPSAACRAISGHLAPIPWIEAAQAEFLIAAARELAEAPALLPGEETHAGTNA